MRRVGYVADRFTDRKSSSHIYRFISLFLYKEERYKKDFAYLLVDSILLSGTPYEKETLNGIMSISRNNRMLRQLFKYSEKTEDDIDFAELTELWERIS